MRGLLKYRRQNVQQLDKNFLKEITIIYAHIKFELYNLQDPESISLSWEPKHI